MNWYFAIAGILVFAIGLVHSLLGERLIFERMRSDEFIPSQGGHFLREPHVRILWASRAGLLAVAVLTVIGQYVAR